MSKEREKYTRKVPALRTIETRDLGRGCKCSLLKRSDGYYQVIFKKKQSKLYLVDDITQYDSRKIEDAFYGINSIQDFNRERENLILDQDEMTKREEGKDLEGRADSEEDLFTNAEKMLDSWDED